MKIKTLLFCLLASIISSSINAQGFTKPSEGKAVIYIVNIMVSPGTKSVFTKDNYLGILQNRDYIRWECNPGQHTVLCLYNANKDFFTADVEVGKIYIMQMRTWEKLGGATPEFTTIENLDSAKKKKAIEKIVSKKKPNDPNTELALKMKKNYRKFADKNFAKYESKWKNKKKYAHINKEMYHKK